MAKAKKAKAKAKAKKAVTRIFSSVGTASGKGTASAENRSRKRHRQPGPKPKKDWPTHVENELKRLQGEGEVVPAASYFVDHCNEHLGVVLDIRAMQRLLKKLLA
jgi:hypothetical protein